ncbi:MAG: hypothetical protein SH856_10910 [Flavobacteriales bacterium]|nr:hypothetical protein [Flavobacteriales bacterium]
MKTLSTLFLLCISAVAFGQAPFLNLISEEIQITEPAASDLETVLGSPAHTIRLYANIPDDWELQVIYGNMFTPLNLDAVDGFYQDADGGPTTVDINPALFGVLPSLAYDSWLTIGYGDNQGNMLLSLPVDEAFFDVWEAGGNLLVNDLFGGSVSVVALPTTFPPNTADANGNVLVGQFTSTGDMSGCLNFQLRKLNPDGSIYDPPGSATSETVAFNNVCFEHTFEIGPGLSCTGDFDINGVIATSDLLLLMADFGCNAACPKDLTGDDTVATTDLLVFLGVFGNECPE